MNTPKVPLVVVVVALGWLTMTTAAAAEGGGAAAEPVAIAEQVVDDLANDQIGAVVARFDAVMRRSFTEARLRTVWTSLKQQVGPFRRRLPSRVEAAGDNQAVWVGCDFRDMEMEARVLINPQGQVVGLNFVPKR